MKILHTSDWHIGHNFFKIDRTDEFKQFFNWLLNTIKQEQVDILIISGDIFDVYFPSNESLKLYYDFLISTKSILKHTIIIGGNHDSPKTLMAPKEILKELNITVVSGAQNDYCEIIEFDDFNIVAISYLREGILRNFPSIQEAFKTIYSSKLTPNKKNIATAHFSVSGAKFSDSEREIGYIESINNNVFNGYDYVALGHIHKPQEIAKNIVYSGSPLSLSFSEDYQKNIILLETDTMEYKFINVPKFRNFARLKGNLESIKHKLKDLPKDSFVEIEFDETLDSFQLDELKNDDIHIIKTIIPYKQEFQTNYKIDNLSVNSVIEEIFKDDTDLEEIKSIINQLKSELENEDN